MLAKMNMFLGYPPGSNCQHSRQLTISTRLCYVHNNNNMHVHITMHERIQG